MRRGHTYGYAIRIDLMAIHQDYCLEYSSDNSVYLRYLTSYNWCDTNHCLPICPEDWITNSDNTSETKRMIRLFPIDMTIGGKMPKKNLEDIVRVEACTSFDFTYTVYIF